MFQYEYEKRPPSRTGPEWSRARPSSSERCHPAIRPLPPRPSSIVIPDKTTVPLRVWIIASASCFAVCAALVLATVVITKWGTTTDNYTTRELYEQESFHQPQYPNFNQPEPTIDDDDLPIYEKLSIFKNLVSNNHKNSQNNEQNKHKNLMAKPQLHPLHDEVLHENRNIKKKDKVVHDNSDLPLVLPDQEVVENNLGSQRAIDTQLINNTNNLEIPSFKPILPHFSNNLNLELPYEYDAKEEYFYNDDNLYDDYMQSNSMTSYLIEKVQELHEWVTTDPDFAINTTNRSDFGSLLKALNDSIVEGNVTIVMSKLKDLYFGDNYTNANSSRKVIVANSTDMLSFGILTLDVMLLHNIQLMAWESQEAMRNKMLKDPDVFAFNALFLDPAKVETKQNEVEHDSSLFLKRLNPRQEAIDDLDIGRNLLENILEVGMSTARAAIHLGRAYKNTKNLLTQFSSSNKETQATNAQNPISRNIDANTHALNHLQTSFDNHNAANIQNNGSFFTELDCVWILYCRNLVATTKLNSPYSTMARINGVALRMLTGELPSNKALDTMLFEAVTGWTELKCNEMFPRCSKANAAAIVIDSILQSHRKSQSTNRGR